MMTSLLGRPDMVSRAFFPFVVLFAPRLLLQSRDPAPSSRPGQYPTKGTNPERAGCAGGSFGTTYQT